MTQIVPLDYRKLSYRPIFLDYVHRYQALAELFPGNPFDRESWSRIARELDAAKYPRAAVCRVLLDLNRAMGADAAALGAASLVLHSHLTPGAR